jgi:hypothetical protein
VHRRTWEEEDSYLLRHTEGDSPPFQTTECQLPAATLGGIIEQLETISIPIIAQPRALISDGSAAGMAYSFDDQTVSLSWYYPPEEWKPLARWHGETCKIFERVLQEKLL